jgi:LysR family transcriptional regulator, nitrogen assimilation regulatory protein
MNLKQLKYFLRAIEVGNITHAAEKLHIAQTALGIQIRNLEDELGVQLLQRHSRGVQPTAAGEILQRHALDILNRVEAARMEVKAAGSSDRLPINVGVTPSIMRLVGSDILVEARRELPNVSLRLVEEFSFMLQNLLEREELQYALTYNTPDETWFTRKALLEEDLLFATSPETSTGTPTITFAEAVQSDLALASRQDVVYRMVHDEARRLSLPVNVMYEVQSVRAIKNLVAKGVAASILPMGAMVEELRKGSIVAQLIERPRITRTLFLVRHGQGVPGLDTERFEAFIGRIVDKLNHAIGKHSRYL